MKIRVGEIPIHLVAWFLILVVPILSTYQVVRSTDLNISFLPIIVLSLALISVFYLNHFILIPRFLIHRKYGAYCTALLCSVVLIVVSSRIVFDLFGFDPEKELVSIDPALKDMSPIARANALLMFIATFLASLALALNNRLKLMEKERLNAQVSSLKSQMSPHFLFNTLNNIYATSLDKAPQTADMIEKLSELMRYTLKEAHREYVELTNEIDYISNFIELQKIRLDDRINLSYIVRGKPGNLRIAPMLLIPFIENAFKHGVNAEEESKIEIALVILNSELGLHVTNNKVHTQRDTIEPSGLGLKNTKRRLELAYPSRHSLKIRETDKLFNVSLHLNL